MKKCVSVILSLLLCFTFIPVQAFADEGTFPVSVSAENKSYEVQETGITGYRYFGVDNKYVPVNLPIYKVAVPAGEDLHFRRRTAL